MNDNDKRFFLDKMEELRAYYGCNSIDFSLANEKDTVNITKIGDYWFVLKRLSKLQLYELITHVRRNWDSTYKKFPGVPVFKRFADEKFPKKVYSNYIPVKNDNTIDDKNEGLSFKDLVNKFRSGKIPKGDIIPEGCCINPATGKILKIDEARKIPGAYTLPNKTAMIVTHNDNT